MKISRREMITGMVAACAATVLPRGLFAETVDEAQYRPTDTGPGKKFSAEGRAQRFPGNTVLCHLSQPGRQFDALQQCVAGLRSKTGEANIVWLPPSSFHMTVFDGSLDSRRQVGDWPQALPRGASLVECHDFVAERLRRFDLGFDPPIRMVADEDQSAPTQTCIPLRPVDAAENKRLRDMRDRMSLALGVRHANHDTYSFHMSFGYYIKAFDPAMQRAYRANLREAIQGLRRQWPVIEAGAPEFCLFDDMTEFHTQFHLQRHERL